MISMNQCWKFAACSIRNCYWASLVDETTKCFRIFFLGWILVGLRQNRPRIRTHFLRARVTDDPSLHRWWRRCSPTGALNQDTQASLLHKPSDGRVLSAHAAEEVLLKPLGLDLWQQSCRQANLIPLGRYFRSSLDSPPPSQLPLET